MTSETKGSPQFRLRVTPDEPGGFDMWQTSVSPMFSIPRLSAKRRSTFAMDTVGYFLPGMAITKTSSSACKFERSRSVIARSGLENILVQTYLTGNYMLEIEGRKQQIRSGDIVVFDLTRECTIDAEPFNNLAITIQRELVAPTIVDIEMIHGLILRNGEPRNNLLRSHMLMTHAEAPNLSLSEQTAVVQGTAALLSACIVPSLPIERNLSPEGAPALQLMRRAIDQRLGDQKMDPLSLAEQFGVSRSSMYRLFKPFGGVRAYIQERRLMQAYHLITNPSFFDEPIGSIAKKVGFNESTTFSRAFRALYKMSPSDVRTAAQRSDRSTHTEPQSVDAAFWMLNRWLLGLEANAPSSGQRNTKK